MTNQCSRETTGKPDKMWLHPHWRALEQLRLEGLRWQREELLKGESTFCSHIFSYCTRLKSAEVTVKRLGSRETKMAFGHLWELDRQKSEIWSSSIPDLKGGIKHKSSTTADVSLKTFAKLWSYMGLELINWETLKRVFISFMVLRR